MVRPTIIALNHIELKCYSFKISLDKCNGSCNVLPPKICVWKKKDMDFKVFNMIANQNEAQAMTKNVSCDCNCKFNITTCNSN